MMSRKGRIEDPETGRHLGRDREYALSACQFADAFVKAMWTSVVLAGIRYEGQTRCRPGAGVCNG